MLSLEGRLDVRNYYVEDIADYFINNKGIIFCKKTNSNIQFEALIINGTGVPMVWRDYKINGLFDLYERNNAESVSYFNFFRDTITKMDVDYFNNRIACSEITKIKKVVFRDGRTIYA
jgi:hypothetical protein